MNIQDWYPLGLTGLISLLSKGLSRVFSSTTVQKNQFFSAQPSLWSSFHIHKWLLEKTIAASLMAQRVKNLPAMQETQVRSLGQEDPQEKGMTPQSSILAWRIPWTKEPGRLQSILLQRVDTTEWLTLSSLYHVLCTWSPFATGLQLHDRSTAPVSLTAVPLVPGHHERSVNIYR